MFGTPIHVWFLYPTALSPARDACCAQVAIVDVRLTSLGIRLKHSMAGVITSTLTVMLLTPLISTVLAVSGEVDLFTFASIPYVIMFILICFLGQDLQVKCNK